MPPQMDSLTLGDQYGRPYLAALWGYRDWHAIGRGIVTPVGDRTILLFITRDKQHALTQYVDHFDGDVLHIEGETNHTHDERLVRATDTGDSIYLFFRDRHHTDFTYFGLIVLRGYDRRVDVPSTFSFETHRTEILSVNSMLAEQAAHGDLAPFAGDEEGRQRIGRHVSYERSARNRARAIEVHGLVCFACGFSFNDIYGPELARDYIEVHHRSSIAEQERTINPETDLVPLCSNCHSIVHRERHKIMPVEMLRDVIRSRRLPKA